MLLAGGCQPPGYVGEQQLQKLQFPETLTLEGSRTLGVEPAPFALADLEARVLVVHAFNHNCPVCNRDAASHKAVYKRLQQQQLLSQVQMLGLGLGSLRSQCQSYVQEHGLNYPVVADPQLQTLPIRHVPQTWILKQGPAGWQVAERIEGRCGSTERLWQKVQGYVE